MKRHSPCKKRVGFALIDCPDRHLGCHATCKEYAEYDSENIELREENLAELRFAEMQANRYFNADKNRKASWQRHNGKGKK